jgi:hypothetical protein
VPSMAGLPVVRRWHVVHRRGKQLLPLAQAFRDFVRDHGGEYANASAAAAAGFEQRARARRKQAATTPNRRAPRATAARLR